MNYFVFNYGQYVRSVYAYCCVITSRNNMNCVVRIFSPLRANNLYVIS